ncbi:MAG: NAD-dependent epimerase/dehydratase family protein [Ignavibacteriales bacterium]|nr:NAD-dependent epimerase/dehydratase family protein [Ignavibacteriales bacterium]
MNILVTGGAGFIGSHVVDEYVQLGHNVVVVDDLSTGSRENLHPKSRFYECDIRTERLAEVFRRERIEVINHHAAQMDVRKSVSDPLYDASINVLGGLNLFEQAREHGVKKIIFASTGGAVYGEQDYFPADEDHPTRPLSPYGISKLVTEKYLFYYQKVHGISSVVLRYANIYGPRQNPHGEAGVVAIFCSTMLNGQDPVINGDGKQTRDYTYVGDVVKANVVALGYGGSAVFNVGTAVETDVNSLFKKLRAHLNQACNEHHGPAKQGEQMRSVVSFKRIQKEFGWIPSVDIQEGLRLTAEYFKNKVTST